MKKVTFLLLAALMAAPVLFAQKTPVKHSFGISFIENDFLTASRIRNASLGEVVNEKRFAKLSEMEPGLQLSYYRSIKSTIDFVGDLGFSWVNIRFANKPPRSSDALLIEASASAQLKMLPDNYVIDPYINLGVGASSYRNSFGAFMPLGAGIRFNLFDEGFVFISTQYRVPVTKETNDYHFVHGIGIAGKF